MQLTGVGFQPDWTWIKERGGANDINLQILQEELLSL